MTDGRDYFEESIPDGISNALWELFPDYEEGFSGQDGYELLIGTFGVDVDGAAFKACTSEHCQKMAACIRDYFEFDEVTEEQGRVVIESALKQWGG